MIASYKLLKLAEKQRKKIEIKIFLRIVENIFFLRTDLLKEKMLERKDTRKKRYSKEKILERKDARKKRCSKEKMLERKCSNENAG